jgi:hypothetical protein
MSQKIGKAVKYVFIADAWDGDICHEIPYLKTYTSWKNASEAYKKFLKKSNDNGGEWQMGLYKCKPGKECEVYVKNNIQKVRNSIKIHEFDYMSELVEKVVIVKGKFKITKSKTCSCCEESVKSVDKNGECIYCYFENNQEDDDEGGSY